MEQRTVTLEAQDHLVLTQQLMTHDNITSTSNSNHRLKSAVDMPICVLKTGDLCDRMSSHENEARFLHQIKK